MISGNILIPRDCTPEWRLEAWAGNSKHIPETLTHTDYLYLWSRLTIDYPDGGEVTLTDIHRAIELLSVETPPYDRIFWIHATTNLSH